ncbi:DUF461 domain-containing protein [Streptomyces sp. NPDC051569]|uniref:DUF461 domain-containing protein n=1 Tax=Streptomyces sp. NPDC051569 TaxID=3365661 RepID=UPI0037AE1409
MSRSLRRGALAASALVISLATLTACGAGNNAQTLGVEPDSAAVTVDTISVQNATVVTQPEADAEGPAVVTGTIFNNGRSAQTLDTIKLPGRNATVKLSAAKGSGPITVPALGSVQLGGEGNASAVIENGHEAARNGDVQEVVFTFSETGDVSLQAFVSPAASYFKVVGPSMLPMPAAPAGTPSGSPSEPGEPGSTETPAEGGTPSESSSSSH